MGGGFGGGMPIPMGVGGLGGGAGLIVLLVVVLLNSGVLGGGGGGSGIDVGPGLDPLPAAPAPAPGDPSADPDAELADFVAFVTADVQDMWTRQFAQGGQQYERTKTVLFSQATQSGCGPASAQTGPFYCTLDRKVYVDLSFFRELRNRFGAPGDFAQAYVIAHEYGHHVQNVLGISQKVQRESQSGDANDLSVRLELQADCLAGVWGHSAFEQDQLSPGDLEEGLGAAAAVGDDRIQRETRGRVDPESFTHGSSEQRTKWFRRGFDRGDPSSCDTFSGDI